MTHEDFIAEVAKRLEWPEEKTTGIIDTILEVVSTELKMNNPVVIDDFGTLKTDIQPEYILMNPETKERHLMPPAVEVVFEVLFQENEEDSLLRASFTPDEALYNDVNSSFSQFEPTPLNEGVQFPGIPEIVAGEAEEESDAPEFSHLREEESLLSEHSSQPGPEKDLEIEKPVEQEEPIEFEVVAEEPELADPPEIIEPVELTGQTEPAGQIEPVEHPITAETVKTPVRTESPELTERADVEQSPPRYRSPRGLRSNKRTSSVWIPIAGGIAIVVASLFFFKGDRNR